MLLPDFSAQVFQYLFGYVFFSPRFIRKAMGFGYFKTPLPHIVTPFHTGK
jgi:hypothetical protein